MDCKISPFQKEIVELIKKTYTTHELLNLYFLKFWKNIYYNDAYVLYKEAITFYKNNQNGNFHAGFGYILNEYLFKGSCQYVYNYEKEEFNANFNIKTTTEDLCRLAINVVNILDQVYEIVPKTPFPIISYRVEYRVPTDDILKMKKGDIYKNLTYLMTSIYPLHTFDQSWYLSNKIKINFLLLLPSGSKTYYLHNPMFFFKDNEKLKKSVNENEDKIISHQENELVIARGSYWKLLNKIKIDNVNFIYIMQLIAQPLNKKLESNKHNISKVIYSENEFKKLSIHSNTHENLLHHFKFEIEVKIKMIKLNQKYAILEKKYEGKKKNNIFFQELQEEIGKKQKSKMLLQFISKEFSNFEKKYPKVEFSKNTNIQLFIEPSMHYYWNIVNEKYNFDGGLYFYTSTYNKSVKDIREITYFQWFTANELYETTLKIRNRTQLTKYLFEHCDQLPLFYKINLKLNKKMEAYDIDSYRKENDPYKNYLYIGKYKLNIYSLDKIYLSDKRYYICMNGIINIL